VSYGTVGPASGGPSGARRVVVLEADTSDRIATEQLLRHQDYWTFATDDPRAVVRVTTVDAADLVLVDLGLEVLDAIPQGQRRRGDTPFPGLISTVDGGYAVLRPLQANADCGRFPLVTLRPGARGDSEVPFCRFAFVDRVPDSSRGDELLTGLESVWRGVVDPAGARDGRAEAAPAPGTRPVGPEFTSPTAFSSTPPPLRTALVVDPDPVSRRFVRTSLARHGFTVHEAASAEDGFHLAIARRPWLIVSELVLPKESGLDFCLRTRSYSILRKTPLVFLAEQDDCDSRYRALKAGADDYVAKPVSERELLVRLELLLKRVADREAPGVPKLALRGAVELVGTSAILQVGHLGRLSGVLAAHRGSHSIRIAFLQGEIVSATSNDRRGPEVVYDFISWDRGLFEFHTGAPGEGPFFRADFNALVLEGCRRLDERHRTPPPGRADSD
jgi:DNA-binding response OmpR family regulator